MCVNISTVYNDTLVAKGLTSSNANEMKNNMYIWHMSN